METPPTGTVYQWMVLPAEVAFMSAVLPKQIIGGEAVTFEGEVQGAEMTGVMTIMPLPWRTPWVWVTDVARGEV